ncbi:MAG TPA: response regulator [Rubrivivax sp.]|nr:response regulator [Rubrivivax sp.]
MRLLYVDDDRINALLFRETCRLAPALEVQTAGSGAEALEVAPRWQPQVLVIDLHLPDTDGCALLPRLRHALAAPALPAFLCTADDPGSVAPAARAAGFAACWPKPVVLHDMLQDMQHALAAQPSAPAP